MKNTALGSNLHAAVVSGSLDQVKALLAGDVDLNTRNQEGNTPLMEAVRHHQPEIGFVLMEAGANLNLKNAQGNTALHLAVSTYGRSTYEDRDNLKARQLWWFLQELYAHGALSLKNNANLSPLMMAIQDESLGEYLRNGFYGEEARSLPFQCDDPYKYLKALQVYHRGGQDPFSYLINAHNAYHRRARDPFSGLKPDSSVSNVLTTEKANLILRDRFFRALRIGNLEAIKGLAERYEFIRKLVKDKVKPVNYVLQVLRAGSSRLSIGRVKEVIAILVQLGADLNKPSKESGHKGDTPLWTCMWDAFHSRGSREYPAAELVVYLLQCGADPNRPSWALSKGWGDTREFFKLIKEPYRASKEQALATAEALLEHGVYCEAKVTLISVEPLFRARMGQDLSRLIESYKTPDPKNLIDQAVIPIMKRVTLIASAIAQGLEVTFSDGFCVSIPKVCDAVKCQKFSRYSTHHLAYLLSLSKNPKIKSMPPLTPEQKKQVFSLIIALSDADFQHTLNDVYARGGANDFREGKAALMIQKHVRGYLAKKSLCASGEGAKHELPPAKFEMTP